MTKYKGVSCSDCDNPAEAKGRCKVCYGLAQRYGFVPKCLDCRRPTTSGMMYGKHKVFKCRDCKARALETINALTAALTK